MAARFEDGAAARPQAESLRPVRDLMVMAGVVLAGAGLLVPGLQWAVSHNTDPLREEVQVAQAHVVNVRERLVRAEEGLKAVDLGLREVKADVQGLKTDVVGLKADMQEMKTDVRELKGGFQRVEHQLQAVTANQLRIVELLKLLGQTGGLLEERGAGPAG